MDSAGIRDVPSPTLPTRGRVSAGVLGTFEKRTQGDTLPFMGRVGEGKSPDAKPA
jgi:hypothetical protein